MRKRPKWRQGEFVPNNKEKFIGTKATYRSGLELKFFRFCDNNTNVLKWGSENVIVPYTSPLDGRVHRYFVENYVINQAKWEAAKKYGNKRGLTFIIITEKELI